MEPFYFLSNDELIYEGNIADENSVFIGVGNYAWFQALYEAITVGNSFQKLYAFDMNDSQITHFKKLIHFIKISDTRKKFMEALFRCDFDNEVLQIDPRSFTDYYGVTSKKVEQGLEVVFDKTVVGDFKKYFIQSDGKNPPKEGHLFHAGYGEYFLKDEEAFRGVKSVLSDTPIEIIQASIETCLKKLMLDNQYLHNVLWVSNIFSKYFMSKNPKLKKVLDEITQYGLNIEPKFPEMKISIIRDQREKLKFKDNAFGNKNRPWSIHSKSFHKVAKYIKGKNNLEVVDVQRWITAQKGISKLPHTIMTTSEEFKQSANTYDTIIFHILVGHGMTEVDMGSLKNLALEKCKRLIILEHNSEVIIDGKHLGVKKTNYEKSCKHYDSACDGRNHIMVFENA
jgi:hypothetical protein